MVRHAVFNQSLYFQNVFFGGHDSRSLCDAMVLLSHVMDRTISLRVLQKAQILLGLLILQEVDSAKVIIKLLSIDHRLNDTTPKHSSTIILIQWIDIDLKLNEFVACFIIRFNAWKQCCCCRRRRLSNT